MMNYNDYIYNRDKIEERIHLVKNSLYGYNTPLSEYVCEKKGVLSDEKIEELADRLIRIMVSYGDYRYGIGGAHRRCLQLYIYLIIKAYGGRVETFGDILEVAADMVRSHDSLEDLILYETDWQPEDDKIEDNEAGEEELGETEFEDAEEYYDEYKKKRQPQYGRGFFGDLDRSYELLTGHRIGDEMTEEELQEIWDRYAVSQKRVLRKYDHLYLEDECREFEEWSEQWYAVREHQDKLARGEINVDEVRQSYRILTEKEQEAARRKEINEKAKWKDSLQNPEKFIEAYKEFRNLFFSIGFDREGLEDAIIYFLCSEGRSGLTDSERFLRVHIQLDKAYRMSEKR